MAVDFVQSAYERTGSSSAAPTFGGSVVEGNAVAVWVGFEHASVTVSSVTDNKGNTYNALTSLVRSSDRCGQWFLATDVIGGSSFQVTATLSGSVGDVTVSIHEFSGVDNDTPTAGTDSVTSNTGGSISAGEDDSMLVGAVYANADTNPDTGNGFTSRWDEVFNNWHVVQTKPVDTGSVNSTFTGGASLIAHQSFVFNPAPPEPPPPVPMRRGNMAFAGA